MGGPPTVIKHLLQNDASFGKMVYSEWLGDMNMDFKELLTRFADRHAIEGLDAGDGAAMLDIDGTEVTFRESNEGGAVVVTALVGEMPPDAKGVFASVALQANFAAAGGVALCVDAETDELSIATSLPLVLADADSLSAAVESLVNTAEEWCRNVVAFLDVDEEAAIAEEDEEGASPLIGDSGFLQV